MSGHVVVVGGNGQGAAQYVVPAGSGGLSRRGRVLATLLTLVLLWAGLSALGVTYASPALTGRQVTDWTSSVASPEVDATAPESSAGQQAHAAGAGDGGTYTLDPAEHVVGDAIDARWGGDTTNLDWTGNPYVTATASFVGVDVASPGDHVERTLHLRNAGPSDAILTVSLSLAETTPAGAGNADLDSAVDLFWDVAGVQGTQQFTTLLQSDGNPQIAEIKVPRGQTVPVTLGFEMPADVTGQRNGGAPSDMLSFAVNARMAGDTTTYAPAPQMPETGVRILGGVAVVAGLLLGGWLLLAATRRRRCDECDERIARGEAYTVRHSDEGKLVLCERCVPVPATPGRPVAAV